MKRIIFIILSLLPIVSCKNFLEEVPKDRISEGNFYNTLDEGQSAVNAIYTPLFDVFSQVYTQQREIAADYSYGRGSTMPIGGEYTGLDATNVARVATIWNYFYKSVNYANIAIEKISELNAIETNKKALVAEARFLRALDYFYLVRNWGAVPLCLDNSATDVGRTPVNEVYNSIVADLKFCEESLPATPKEYGRPSSWAAKSLLSEVYLNMENWSLAASKAKEVIDNGPYSLIEVQALNDFDKIFGANANGTKEEIFYYKFSHKKGGRWPDYYLWNDDLFSNFGTTVMFLDPKNPFIAGWDETDWRKQWDVFTHFISKTTGKDTQLPSDMPMGGSKFRDPAAPTMNDYSNDFPILRYADVLLIYAEAASQAGNGPTPQAIESLNKIKRRGYGYPSNSPSPVDYTATGWTAESFRDAIVKERGYEFIFECKRWLDLIRTGRVKKEVLKNKGKVVNDKMLLWPIPIAEINSNSLIKQANQNPGY